MTTVAPLQVPPAHGRPVAGTLGFTHHVDQANGSTVHAVVCGAGPAVFLLHGWPMTWRVWRPLLPVLAGNDFTVVAMDLRGTGDSGKPEGGFTKRDVAEDVHQLLGQLGFASATVVGMDIGAMVGYAYAASHPAEVDRLVLAESVLPGFGLGDLMNPATGGFWHFGFHMQVDLASMLTEGMESEYLAPTLDMFSAGGLTAEDKADIIAHYSAPNGMRGGFQHYASLLQDGLDNRQAARVPLTMPVLVLNGEHGLPQEPLLNGVRQLASDVRADVVPASGHTFGVDNPGWTADRLTHFIRDAT